MEPNINIPFSYEVNWHKSDIKFDDRFDKYLNPNFFQHRIHWFSIFNSFMMVIFLVGLVSMILMRTLRKDYARYSRDEEIDDIERDLGDEYGWKQVHGDVFRPVSQPILFTALVGSGYQVNKLFSIYQIDTNNNNHLLSFFLFHCFTGDNCNICRDCTCNNR